MSETTVAADQKTSLPEQGNPPQELGSDVQPTIEEGTGTDPATSKKAETDLPPPGRKRKPVS